MKVNGNFDSFLPEKAGGLEGEELRKIEWLKRTKELIMREERAKNER